MFDSLRSVTGDIDFALFNTETQSVWRNILYCNLVQESILSVPGLQILAAEILADCGPMTVDQLAERLSIETRVPQLVQKIQIKFQGLVHFLSESPDLFVCAQDDEVNPHIVLRRSISQFDQQKIDSTGYFPPELLESLIAVSFV